MRRPRPHAQTARTWGWTRSTVSGGPSPRWHSRFSVGASAARSAAVSGRDPASIRATHCFPFPASSNTSTASPP